MKIHPDFQIIATISTRGSGKRNAIGRGTRGQRVYPSTPARADVASLLAKLPSIAPLPTNADWHWDADGLITF